MQSGGFLRAGAIALSIFLTALTSQGALRVQRVVGGLTKPLFVTQAPGDDDRLFIVEQHSGRILIFKNSTAAILAAPFLQVSPINTGGEQGLLGLAFHPNYAANGLFYVNYTTGNGAGRTEIASFTSSTGTGNADTAVVSSKKVLLTFTQPEANHNGGWMGFGKDGYLYIASGDGGGGNDVHGSIGNGQNRANLLGKILRIEVGPGIATYNSPAGNPFKGNTSNFREEIWAFGLRNPWRCSIDRVSGDLWIGDVGQGAREEIDLNPSGQGGLNFGWRPREGKIQTPAYPNEQPVTPATDPIYDYARSLGVSVTGGYRYRGTQVPELEGKYIFADFGSSRFWTLLPTNPPVIDEVTTQVNPSTPSPRPISGVSSFGEDNAGELYICDYAGGTANMGEIYKIVSTVPPVIIRLVDVKLSDDGTKLEFTFPAKGGMGYEIETRATFNRGVDWQNHKTLPARTSDGNYTASVDVTGNHAFFRIRELP